MKLVLLYVTLDRKYTAVGIFSNTDTSASYFVLKQIMQSICDVNRDIKYSFLVFKLLEIVDTRLYFTVYEVANSLTHDLLSCLQT